MSNSQKHEVIIVGAGRSGLTAARVLSSAGVETIVLERGTKPAEKSSYSEIINVAHLEQIFDNFWEKDDCKLTPYVERVVSEYRAYILQDDTSTLVKRKKAEFEKLFNNKTYSVLSQTFIKKLSEMVQSSGAKILYKECARNLIVKDGKVVGVRTDDKDFYSDTVIIAEGSNPVLTKSAGLRKGVLTPKQIFLFAEETFELPSDVINERFEISSHEGIAMKFFTCFNEHEKVKGVGYLNTNKNSILLGIGILLSDSVKSGVNVNKYLEAFKKHPVINPLIKDSVLKGYFSYTLPSLNNESKSSLIPKLFVDGCLVTGHAATFVDVFDFDYSSFSFISGKLAAEAILQAHKIKKYSRKTLSAYLSLLHENNEMSAFFTEKLIPAGLPVYKNCELSENDPLLTESLNSYLIKKDTN